MNENVAGPHCLNIADTKFSSELQFRKINVQFLSYIQTHCQWQEASAWNFSSWLTCLFAWLMWFIWSFNFKCRTIPLINTSVSFVHNYTLTVVVLLHWKFVVTIKSNSQIFNFGINLLWTAEFLHQLLLLWYNLCNLYQNFDNWFQINS